MHTGNRDCSIAIDIIFFEIYDYQLYEKRVKEMIRNVRSEDAQALVSICKTALFHETDSVTMKRRIQELSLNDSYYIAVYEDDNDHRVLGFIQAERYNLLYAGNGWNIIALAVDPEAQRHGIGKKLLNALEEKASDDQYTFIRLNCNIIREKAHVFYQSMGYICDKTQKRFIKEIN